MTLMTGYEKGLQLHCRKEKQRKKKSIPRSRERERESTYTSHAVKTTKVTIGEKKEDKNMRKQLYQNTTETVTRIFIRHVCVQYIN